MEQINKMAFAIAELRSTLDVYKGLFLEKTDAEVLFSRFNEIGHMLHKSLSINLIISCSALFVDPDTSFGDENMSFPNLYKKHGQKLSDEAVKLRSTIDTIVIDMNLRVFRNKHVGHFGLIEKLGKKYVVRNITTQNIEDLLVSSEKMLNLIIRDAQLLPAGHSLAFYTPIPESRSPKKFLAHLSLS